MKYKILQLFVFALFLFQQDCFSDEILCSTNSYETIYTTTGTVPGTIISYYGRLYKGVYQQNVTVIKEYNVLTASANVNEDGQYSIKIFYKYSYGGGEFPKIASRDWRISFVPTTGWLERGVNTMYHYVRYDSELETNSLGNKIYYINSNKDVSNLWKNGTSWGDGPLNSSAEKAESGTGLLWNPADDAVYYIGTRDYKIHRLYWTGSGWSEHTVCPSQSTVRSISELVTNNAGSEIYFVTSNYKVSHLWKSEGVWVEGLVNTSALPTASGRGGLAFNSTLDELYYIANDMKIKRLYFDNGWQYEQLCPGQWIDARSTSEIEVAPWGTSIAYVASDGRMCQFYRVGSTGSNWGNGDFVPSAPKVKDGTNFIYDNDGIFYIDVNNKIQKLSYSSSTGWYVETVHQECQNYAVSDLVKIDGSIYYNATNDNLIHELYYVSASLKKGLIDDFSEENDELFEDELNISIVPNPTNGQFYVSNLETTSAIELYDTQGRSILKVDSYCGELLDIAEHKKGLYILRISNQNRTVTKKVVFK